MTPVFYVLVRKLAGNRPLTQHNAEEHQALAAGE
jgi:multidrug efflux pump